MALAADPLPAQTMAFRAPNVRQTGAAALASP